MSGLVDFQEVKERVTFEQALGMLGLEYQERNGQIRLACPHCGGSDRSLVITPSKGLFYCFSSQGKDGGKGDILSFVAHCEQTAVKEAAQKLAGTFLATSRVPSTGTGKGTSPEERSANQTKKLEPLSHLESDHDAVTAVGLDTRVAERLGIGYRTKGAGVGSVMIPVRNEHGDIEGYVGVQELTYIPPDFKLPDNVVPLRKQSA